MGTLKLELELPEFNHELSITLSIRKDGEVIYSASPDPTSSRSVIIEETPSQASLIGEDKPKKPVKKVKSQATPSNSLLGGGNMMSLDF